METPRPTVVVVERVRISITKETESLVRIRTIEGQTSYCPKCCRESAFLPVAVVAEWWGISPNEVHRRLDDGRIHGPAAAPKQSSVCVLSLAQGETA